MSDDTTRRDRERRLSEEAALSARLRHLGDRIDRERSSKSPESTPGVSPTTDGSAMARGLRLSSELVAGVLVGAVIGWLLDYWIGTSPWGLSVFLLLGFVAGVFNVIRAAQVMSGGSWPRPQ